MKIKNISNHHLVYLGYVYTSAFFEEGSFIRSFRCRPRNSRADSLHASLAYSGHFFNVSCRKGKQTKHVKYHSTPEKHVSKEIRKNSFLKKFRQQVKFEKVCAWILFTWEKWTSLIRCFGNKVYKDYIGVRYATHSTLNRMNLLRASAWGH